MKVAAERAAAEAVAAARAAALETEAKAAHEAAAAAEERSRAIAKQRVLKAKQRRATLGAQRGAGDAGVPYARYGAGEHAPSMPLQVGDGVLLRDCPAPGYACWALVTRLDADALVVMRDLSRSLLKYTPPLRDHNGNPTNAANPACYGGGGDMGRAFAKAGGNGERGGGNGGRGGGNGERDASLKKPNMAPDGYTAENLCLPLRRSASGRWTLPQMSPEDVLFALPAEDYADLSFATEQPPDYTSYEVPETGAETGAEPHARLLVAARREISMWAASADDLGAALASLWPELQRGFALVPGRSGQREALPKWEPSFLAIPDVSSRSPSRRVSPAPFFSSDEVPFVGL
jgi:hypothetical protein